MTGSAGLSGTRAEGRVSLEERRTVREELSAKKEEPVPPRPTKKSVCLLLPMATLWPVMENMPAMPSTADPSHAARLSWTRLAGRPPVTLALLVLLLGLVQLGWSQNPPADTTDTFGEDEYYDEFDEEAYDDEAFDDEFYDEFEEGEFEDEGLAEDEFFDEGDEFFDEEGFEDEFVDEEPLEAGAPARTAFDELELADDNAGQVNLDDIVEEQAVKAPRVLRGFTAKVSIASPWWLGATMQNWTSSTDARLSLEVPQQIQLGPVPISYSLEVSSFNFVNFYPQGGELKGVALLVISRFPVGPLTGMAGGGIYGSTKVYGGVTAGLSYGLNLFRYFRLSVDSRVHYVHNAISYEDNITAGGGAVWLDIGGAIGYRF